MYPVEYECYVDARGCSLSFQRELCRLAIYKGLREKTLEDAVGFPFTLTRYLGMFTDSSSRPNSGKLPEVTPEQFKQILENGGKLVTEQQNIYTHFNSSSFIEFAKEIAREKKFDISHLTINDKIAYLYLSKKFLSVKHYVVGGYVEVSNLEFLRRLQEYDPTPQINIGGHKVKFLEDKIEVGCQTVSKELIKEIYDYYFN